MKHLLNNHLKNLAFRGKKLLSRGAELLIYANLFFEYPRGRKGVDHNFKLQKGLPFFVRGM